MTDGAALTSRERRLIARLRTPLAVQRYLNELPYNQEPHGRATLRSFRGVVQHGVAITPQGDVTVVVDSAHVSSANPRDLITATIGNTGRYHDDEPALEDETSAVG